MGEKAIKYRRIACRLVLIGLLLSIAGCADNSAGNSDRDKNSGFYSGASGGWSHL
jgi:hypothetical protein